MNTLARAKYRAKRIDNGEFVTGILIDSHIGPMILVDNEVCDLVDFISGIGFSCIGNLVDRKTVGQFTGKQDRNGVDIFEGMKIRNLSGRVCVVEWFEVAGSWDCRVVDNDIGTDSIGFYVEDWHRSVEVLK